MCYFMLDLFLLFVNTKYLLLHVMYTLQMSTWNSLLYSLMNLYLNKHIHLCKKKKKKKNGRLPIVSRITAGDKMETDEHNVTCNNVVEKRTTECSTASNPKENISSTRLKIIDYDSTDESENEEENSAIPPIAINAVENVPITENVISKPPDLLLPNSLIEPTSTTNENDVEMVSYRDVISSRHSDSSSDSSSSESENETEIHEYIPTCHPVKVKGEFGLDDLPHLEDLMISVDEAETSQMGEIVSIVDQLVVVQSFKCLAPLDIDTVLFLDNGHRTLGRIFDVMGPVSEVMYCVRFNSNKEIIEKGILVGAAVFYAPKTVHTSFVFLPDLLKLKGSDASWEDDIEPPKNHLDYSDDEKERNASKKKSNKNTNRTPDGGNNGKVYRNGPRMPGTSNPQNAFPRQQYHRPTTNYNAHPVRPNNYRVPPPFLINNGFPPQMPFGGQPYINNPHMYQQYSTNYMPNVFPPTPAYNTGGATQPVFENTTRPPLVPTFPPPWVDNTRPPGTF